MNDIGIPVARRTAPRRRSTAQPQAMLNAKPITQLPAAGTALKPTRRVAADSWRRKRRKRPPEPLDLAAVETLVADITIECRRYEDLRRAWQRLNLQTKSACLYASDGDKVEGAKLYAEARTNPAHPMAVWLDPYFNAMVPIGEALDKQEAAIIALTVRLPIIAWADSVAGLSARYLGMVIGECGAPIGDYKSVSAVWKRMGLAVINGVRQRRLSGEAALIHGYVAHRRSLMWNIGENLLKAQVRRVKDEQGNLTGWRAIGPYGEIYLERKALETTRIEGVSHVINRAKRYMEKRFLADLFREWRKTQGRDDFDPQRVDSEAKE